MRYRVMASDGTLEDFDTESEARAVFTQKKVEVGKAKIIGDIQPSCNIHKCYHSEPINKPCEIIEEYRKGQVNDIASRIR